MRYGLALVMLIAAPTAVCYWITVHAFISLWRKLGRALSYCIFVPMVIALGYGIFSQRKWLLAHNAGANDFLILFGELIALTDIWLFVLVAKNLPLRTFIGLPEIDPKKYPTRLIKEGIYAHIRHPRYAQVLVMIFACSLIVNYTATYVLFLLSIVGFYCVAWLEDRELERRFGREYEEYRREVPMFVPKM